MVLGEFCFLIYKSLMSLVACEKKRMPLLVGATTDRRNSDATLDEIKEGLPEPVILPTLELFVPNFDLLPNSTKK